MESAGDFHNLVDTDKVTHIGTGEPAHNEEHTEAEPLHGGVVHIEEGIEEKTCIVG